MSEDRRYRSEAHRVQFVPWPMYQHAQSDKPVADALAKVFDAASSLAPGTEAAEDCGTFVAREGLRAVE